MINFLINNPKWDNEQKIVLNSKPNIIVSGCAGSGKTLLSIHLAKELSINGKFNILIIVYTKSLKKFICEALDFFRLTNVKVMYEAEYSRTQIENIDYIIIDEAQDFSINDIKRFQSKSKIGIYIFADDNQRLYETNNRKEQTLTISKLENELNFPIIELKSNYRISKNITEFIKNMNEDCNLTNYSNEFGDKPLFIKANSPDQELKFILKYILESSDRNIAILLIENDPVVGNYLANGNKVNVILPGILETLEFFTKNNIQCGFKYRSDDRLIFTNNKSINILTYHSSKGLEFDTVILPFSNILNQHKNASVNYVGMTRSKTRLIVTYSDIISNDYNKNISNEKFEGQIRVYNQQKDFPQESKIRDALKRAGL